MKSKEIDLPDRPLWCFVSGNITHLERCCWCERRCGLWVIDSHLSCWVCGWRYYYMTWDATGVVGLGWRGFVWQQKFVGFFVMDRLTQSDWRIVFIWNDHFWIDEGDAVPYVSSVVWKQLNLGYSIWKDTGLNLVIYIDVWEIPIRTCNLCSFIIDESLIRAMTESMNYTLGLSFADIPDLNFARGVVLQ